MARCFVPTCTRKSHAGGMCGRHYMQAYEGRPFTEPCDGICGKPHPLFEPPDPPLPAGLADACTLILRMHSRPLSRR